LWLLFLALLWGPSFLFIKVAVLEIPPFTLVLYRVSLAAILLYFVLTLLKRKLPRPGVIWKHFAVVGLFAHVFPFLLFSWGEIFIDSAVASILNGTTPLFTLLIAHFSIHDDRMTTTKVVGTLIGFGGLLLLVSPSLQGGIQANTLGLIAVTVAACSYGIALVYARLKLVGLPPLVAPTAQLIIAFLFMLPVTLIIEQPFNISLPSLPAVGSLLALSVLGTAVAFVVYYRILEHTSATFLSTVTYLVPIFGIILGVVVLDEILQWQTYAGCVMILFGVMIVNRVFNSSKNVLGLVLRRVRQPKTPVQSLRNGDTIND
jgi:drug/metabolite transporter (DMT)-like permease